MKEQSHRTLAAGIACGLSLALAYPALTPADDPPGGAAAGVQRPEDVIPPETLPGPATLPSEPPTDEERRTAEELVTVRRFLSLNPEELRRIREAIEEIEGMSQGDKVRLLARIEAFKRERPRVGALMGAHASPSASQEWLALRWYWSGLSEAEQQTTEEEVKAMTPEAQKAFIAEVKESYQAMVRSHARKRRRVITPEEEPPGPISGHRP